MRTPATRFLFGILALACLLGSYAVAAGISAADVAQYKKYQKPALETCSRGCIYAMQRNKQIMKEKMNITAYCQASCACDQQELPKTVPYASYKRYLEGRPDAKTRSEVQKVFNVCAQRHIRKLVEGKKPPVRPMPTAKPAAKKPAPKK